MKEKRIRTVLNADEKLQCLLVIWIARIEWYLSCINLCSFTGEI